MRAPFRTFAWHLEREGGAWRDSTVRWLLPRVFEEKGVLFKYLFRKWGGGKSMKGRGDGPSGNEGQRRKVAAYYHKQAVGI